MSRSCRPTGSVPSTWSSSTCIPFESTVARADCTLAEAIENIDIGGPALVRAAAKNHAAVTVMVDPDDYVPLIEEMRTANAASAPTRAIAWRPRRSLIPRATTR